MKGLYKRADSDIWWMAFTYDSKTYRKSTGASNRKMAESILAKVKTQIVEGKWFEIEQAKQHTFDEMMDRFIREHAPSKEPKTQKSYRNCLVHLNGFFSGMTLDKLDTDKVLEYVALRRGQRCRPGTRNRELATLSKAFNLARLWKWTRENPCQLVKREKEDNENVGRCLTLEEERKLLEACRRYMDGQLVEMVIVALNSGIREGEVLKLRWDKINLSERTFESYNEKTNSWRTIPMNNTLYRLLSEKGKVRNISGYVFATSAGTPFIARNLLREWYKAVKEAKIGKLRFHDLRHTVGTRLGRNGLDVHAIASILDHSQLSTTRRYVKHNTESMRRGLSILDKNREELHVFFTVRDSKEKREAVSH